MNISNNFINYSLAIYQIFVSYLCVQIFEWSNVQMSQYSNVKMFKKAWFVPYILRCFVFIVLFRFEHYSCETCVILRSRWNKSFCCLNFFFWFCLLHIICWIEFDEKCQGWLTWFIGNIVCNTTRAFVCI